MNSGPNKPDYKSKMLQQNTEEGRIKLKGKVKGWKDTMSRKG